MKEYKWVHKGALVASVISVLILLGMIIQAWRIMFEYISTIEAWRFWFALAGFIILVSLVSTIIMGWCMLFFIRIVQKKNKNQNSLVES